jgi:hypothetical protein
MRKEHWQDWGTVLIGLWLVVTPWVLGAKSGSAAETTFWATGLFIIALGASELSFFARWKEWLIAAAGTWMFLSPRLLDFTDGTLIWNAAVCGLAVVALAAWAIGDAHEILPRLNRAKDDLRGDQPGIAVPDEHEHMAGQHERRPGGPGETHPGVDVQAPGQGSHA